MNEKVDHYGSQYSNFVSELYEEIRKDAFEIDIGQNGWLTADEQDIFIDWLELNGEIHLLDIACGSGGPTLRISEKTGCTVTGIDIHEDGIKAANTQAKSRGLTEKTSFIVSDGSTELPFENETFDAVYCIDAINHLPDRAKVLKEWNRILKPGGRLVFTDPITITGVISKDDIDVRSSIGYFLFAADGADERLLKNAGFEVKHKTDRTENMKEMAEKWKDAREKRAGELIKAEGREAFEGQQIFFKVCEELAKGKDLSRFAFLAVKK